MIARLKGIVDSLGDGWVVIDVSGVGYLVFCSARTLGRLAVGEAAAVDVETHVREDHIHLYGFLDTAERDWFRLLTTVQGVGAKVGLAILSVLGSEELLQAVAAGDRAAVSRASGVGPKLAKRILSELRDKVGAIALGPASAAAGGTAEGGLPTATADAVSALVNLGYNPSEALGAVSRGAGELGPEAGVEVLIRAGLNELGAREPREHSR